MGSSAVFVFFPVLARFMSRRKGGLANANGGEHTCMVEDAFCKLKRKKCVGGTRQLQVEKKQMRGSLETHTDGGLLCSRGATRIYHFLKLVA